VCGRVTWACACVARYSPGYHIAGLQPGDRVGAEDRFGARPDGMGPGTRCSARGAKAPQGGALQTLRETPSEAGGTPTPPRLMGGGAAPWAEIGRRDRAFAGGRLERENERGGWGQVAESINRKRDGQARSTIAWDCGKIRLA
jgi:hypothetical protein